MTILPKSRQSDIVVQSLSKELLVYDLLKHEAYQLNEPAMIVFNACGDAQSFEDLKRKHKFTDDLIYLTLDSLKEKNLLEADYISPLPRTSRREMIRRVGLASMIALPVISALVAPTAAQAASSCAANGTACTFSNNTQSNCCNSNQRCFTTNANPTTCMNCYPAATALASCQTAGCCNQRSDKNLCCSGTYNESTTNGTDYVCRCAP